MILSLFKRIGECDHALRRGWNEPRVTLMGKDLLNKNVGIIGLGNTGGRVAEICKVALNCNILAYDPYLADETFKKKNANKMLNKLNRWNYNAEILEGGNLLRVSYDSFANREDAVLALNKIKQENPEAWLLTK